LLQLLPDLPPAQRQESAKSYVARNAADLPGDLRAGIVRETMAILENVEWSALFGLGSLAEVPVTGMANGRLISAQIDRLVVTDREVLIVDYKTNRPPPQTQADIPALYIRQMDAYRDIVARIYPGRRVRAFLLWTDGPKLMELTY
jgi:ATP-dependent helicase/nuclease subunit A